VEFELGFMFDEVGIALKMRLLNGRQRSWWMVDWWRGLAMEIRDIGRGGALFRPNNFLRQRWRLTGQKYEGNPGRGFVSCSTKVIAEREHKSDCFC
jgi:hypothetical protein